MSERKPRVDPLVPTRAIDKRLGRVHVAMPDAYVVALVQEELDQVTDPRWTPALKRQTIRYALWRHHRNFADYQWVMGPH